MPAFPSYAFTRWRHLELRQETSNCSLLLIYRPRRDERLSWPGWFTHSGRFTHISGHPSATGGAQDRESTPAEDRRSTTEPRNQPRLHYAISYVIIKSLSLSLRPVGLFVFNFLMFIFIRIYAVFSGLKGEFFI